MKFTNVGKTYQMVIENGNDLEGILTLDEAIWGATSAPTIALKTDPVLIKALDPTASGRITSNALKDAISWLLAQLPNRDKITADFDGKLPLADIDTANPTGQALVASAKYILGELKAEDKEHISLEQIRTFCANVAKLALNGDGVISVAAAGSNEKLKNLVLDTVAATGGSQDLDGSLGATDKNVADFLAAANEYLAWRKQGDIPAGETKTDIMTFGADTPALAALSAQNAAKVEDFFKLCSMLAFDDRLVPQALGPVGKANAFDPANPDEVDAYLNGLPISTPVASNLLTLDPDKINPLYRNWWIDVAEKIIKPILGDVKAITRQDWAKIRGTFAAFETYMAGKKGAIVEKIAIDKLQDYVSDKELLPAAAKLQELDKAVADTTKAAREVEKLLLYRTNLIRLANNFVSFSELYDKDQIAMFECGRLVIDGRWFNVTFHVENPAGHLAMAKPSLMCLMYIEVTKNGTKFNYVSPVTYGSKGNLGVGKRGVYFDLDGKEYDAVITQFVENPVCVREALLAPFSRLWNIVESKIESWSGDAEKKLQADFTKVVNDPKTVAAATATATAPPAAAKPAADKSGMFLGVSVAIAALGSAFAFISKTLAGMSLTGIIITIICALLVIMLPITILTYIKLRKQDLSAVLEGCGWAINLRMKLTSKLRGQFTNFGKYPKGASGTPVKRYTFVYVIILILIALAYGGKYWYDYKKEKEAKAANPVEAAKMAEEDANKTVTEKVAEAAKNVGEKIVEDVKKDAQNVKEQVVEATKEAEKKAEAAAAPAAAPAAPAPAPAK